MSIIYISPSVEIVEPILSARQDPVEQYYLSFEPHTEKKKNTPKTLSFQEKGESQITASTNLYKQT